MHRHIFPPWNMNWRGHWWFRLQEGRGHQGDLASELLEEHYGRESDGAFMGNKDQQYQLSDRLAFGSLVWL